ncbi:MAG: mechanosensitive ion channel family protein [Bacteroidota bacterium]
MLDLEYQEMFQHLIDKLSGWAENLFLMLPNFLLALLVMLAFGFAATGIRKLVANTLDRFSNNEAVNRLVSKMSMFLVLCIGVFVSLGILQLRDTVMTLLGGIGIAGLALGFAFQEIAANFISGIMIAVRKPFQIGDLIKIGDHMGHIEEIALRTSNIRTLQGQIAIIPNKTLYQGEVIKYTAGTRRIDIEVGVAYGDSLRKAKKEVEKAMKEVPNVDTSQPIDCVVTGFGASSINLLGRFWIRFPEHDYFEAKSEAIIRIKERFDQAGISIPFPIRTLDLPKSQMKEVASNWLDAANQHQN